MCVCPGGGATPASGPVSFPGGTHCPVTGPVQNPVPGAAQGDTSPGTGQGVTPDRTGCTPPPRT